MSPAGLPPLAAEDHTCGGCGLVYSAVSLEAADRGIAALPARLAAAAAAVPEPAVRRRPEPAVWSVVEYLCHVRDVYATFTIRLHRAVTEDTPALEPMFADLRAERFGYARSPVDAVLDELTAAAAGFRAEVAATPAGAWDRRVTRLPGEYRTALWLVRQAFHEGVHHLGDVERVGRPAAGSSGDPGRGSGAGSGGVGRGSS